MASSVVTTDGGPSAGAGIDPGAALSVAGVSKAFGETQALKSCSFSARPGEIHALVGENGSGKSTLAKVLAGVIPPDEGTVTVLGGTPTSPLAAHRLGLAMVFQEILVAEGASVLDNLFLGHDGIFRAAWSTREKKERASAVLDRLAGERVDLSANVDELPLSLRQWIVIARALLGSPQVLILDEATAALDQSSVGRFFEETKRLKEQGVCVLVVTHRIHELTQYCDRATVLRDGVHVGTVAGADLTEDQLLALMSGEGRMLAVEHFEDAGAAQAMQQTGEKILDVSALRLTDRSEPIDLSVAVGEVVGFVGLEGQGQAEFIRTVAGIDKPYAGQVRILRDGSSLEIDSPQAADRAGVSYIPGDRKLEGLFQNLSVFENFAVPCYRRARRFGFIDSRKVRAMFQSEVAELSVRLGRSTAPINSLSGGNQQKIVIGRSLAASPLVIALNDPTRGVDIATKRDLYGLLKDLAAQGRAVLFLSNEIEEFPGLCDRVMVFRSGSVSSCLRGDEITDDNLLAALFGRTAVRKACSIDE